MSKASNGTISTSGMASGQSLAGWDRPKTPGTSACPFFVEVEGKLFAFAHDARQRDRVPFLAQEIDQGRGIGLFADRDKSGDHSGGRKRYRGDEVPRHAPSRVGRRDPQRGTAGQGFLPHGLLASGDHHGGANTHQKQKWAGPPTPLEYGSSRACSCRWAPCVRDHDPGQEQLPMSTIKAPGYRIPDARSSTRPAANLGSRDPRGNALDANGGLFQQLADAGFGFFQGFRAIRELWLSTMQSRVRARPTWRVRRKARRSRQGPPSTGAAHRRPGPRRMREPAPACRTFAPVPAGDLPGRRHRRLGSSAHSPPLRPMAYATSPLRLRFPS